jgi:hypothetical protein
MKTADGLRPIKTKSRQPTFCGAVNQIRTGDLILTKDVLCLLSYNSILLFTINVILFAAQYRPSILLAGAEGFEPSARGFGDRCSTN